MATVISCHKQHYSQCYSKRSQEIWLTRTCTLLEKGVGKVLVNGAQRSSRPLSFRDELICKHKWGPTLLSQGLREGNNSHLRVLLKREASVLRSVSERGEVPLSYVRAWAWRQGNEMSSHRPTWLWLSENISATPGLLDIIFFWLSRCSHEEEVRQRGNVETKLVFPTQGCLFQ